MTRRLAAVLLAMMFVLAGTTGVFAETGGYEVFDSRFYGDYSTESVLSNSSLNAGCFSLELMLDSVSWLNITGAREGKVNIRSTAASFDINEAIPNLKTFAIAERIAQTSLVGYTFACSNHGGHWDVSTGEWVTQYNDPEGRIRAALDVIGGYITTKNAELRTDGKINGKEIGKWTDNKLTIPKGTVFQLGTNVLEFTRKTTIDDIYDPVKHPNEYKSQFAYFVYNVKRSVSLSTSDENRIYILIPAGTVLQTCETVFTVSTDIPIEITCSNMPDGSSLGALYDAIGTAEGANSKYAGFNCDADALYANVFAVINDLVGVAADKDTVIAVGNDTELEPQDIEDKPETVKAEFRITTIPQDEVQEPCSHANTKVVDRIEPTFTTVGFTGDTYCADCGELLKEGDIIAKKPSSIKLNATSLKLKVKQSSSALKVSFAAGDSIKSVKSSKTSIVQASKAGTDKIKLKAGKKTGTAKVTVTLASGKSAVATVKVQKKAVACTGIKVGNGTSVSLKKGTTHQIKAVRAPITCVQKITYKSSNKKVATVTSKGKVKARKKGTAKITVKCGSKKKVIKVKAK